MNSIEIHGRRRTGAQLFDPGWRDLSFGVVGVIELADARRPRGQLTQVLNTTPNNPSTTFNYGYDSASNRTSDNSATYSVNDLNEITNTGYAYDADGNLTTDGVNTYQWDAANRMTAIIYAGTAGRSEFTYDGLGRRVKILEKDGNGTVQKTSNFVWSGMTIAEERNSANTVMKRFLAEGVQLPTGTFPNTKLYYSKDHLGSIRSLSNENGTIMGTVDYDAYGGISRAPVPANDTSGSGPVLTSAVSQVTHSFAGTFNLNLPLSGAPGVEMRNAAGAYKLILTFDRNVLSDTSTTLAAGVGSVSSTTFSGSTATVQLSGIADRQTITVELDNVVGVTGVNAKVLVSMSICIGDVTQSGAVTVEDINAVKAHSGNAVTSSTFQYDLNHDGYIDSIDTAQDKSVVGDSVYPDFAFTGHYYHARSGLYLAPYRAYNPTIGRWLSRDPLGDDADLNLYRYVNNNSPNSIDPLGLKSCFKWFLVTFYNNRIGNHENPLTENDAATANQRYSPNGTQRPTYSPDASVNQPYPNGMQIIVYRPNAAVHADHRTINDSGAGWAYPRPGLPNGVSPDEWLDLYSPRRARSGNPEWDLVETVVGDNCPCPPNWTEDRNMPKPSYAN
jgi:RHS repeat-associated protein